MNKNKNNNVRVPQISSVEKAVEIYYSKPELTSADITELFGKHSPATISRLKAKVRAEMIKENVPVWNSQNVHTATAYKTWGLSIDDLEHRLKKLRELKSLTA